MSVPEPPNPVFAGVRAARLLEEACRPAAAKYLQLEFVRGLALDIGRELDALGGLARETTAPDVRTEAALRCADLANLAACNAPELPSDEAPQAVAAARLAAGSVCDLRSLVEGGVPDEEHAGNLLRDLRSAAWRAEFATLLVDEPPGGESSTS